jgi:hypothetical protein
MRGGWVILGLAVASIPSTARAANGLRPRTPATFGDPPCLLTVDKRAEPMLHIGYAVSNDDTALTADELEDSRRHQFFALGHQVFDYQMPVWINQADFDRAQANGDITKEFGSDDVLESSPAWPPGSWHRITPDDARLPITLEQAQNGVDWDLTAVDPGTWIVAAYTWEPENNIWSYRMGAIRVVDPDATDPIGPSVFLAFDDVAQADVGEPYAARGCIAAEPGSTMTASWGRIVGLDEPQWVAFVEDAPARDGTFDLEFVPPPEAAQAKIRLRLEVTDPRGNSYVAFSPAPVQVYGSADTTDPQEEGGGGPGCRVVGRPTPIAACMIGLVLLGLRRRD